ncbi:hypothetical protein [Algoriphagus sp. A40]|uniref:hypothetical protein n=1 Tax=Algoriphagus sp. A40 TaxID=1945863 RepID=UPI001C2BC66E|nr:hypothetical protein [Algoriphagus sp. A40]
MKKLLLLVIIICTFSWSGYSQNSSLPFKTKEIKSDTKDDVRSIIGSDRNGVYVSGFRNSNAFIEFFDLDFNLTRSISLDGYNYNADGPNERNIEFFFIDKEREKLILAFTTYKDYVSSLYFVDIDTNSGLISDSRLVYSEKGINRKNTFAFVEDKNEIFFGVYSLLPTPSEKFESSLFMIVFNKDFKPIKSNHVTLPIKLNLEGEMDSSKKFVLLSTKGDFVFLMKIGLRKARKNGYKDYYYHVFQVSDVSGEYKQSILGNADDKNLADVFIHEGDSGNLICVGTYIDESGYIFPATLGVAVYTIDPRNFGDPSYSFIPFSTEQIAQLQTKKGQYLGKAIRKKYTKKRLAIGAPAFGLNSSRLEQDETITLFGTSSALMNVRTGSLNYTMEHGGDMYVMSLSDSRNLSIHSVQRNYFGVTSLMPNVPVFDQIGNSNGILFLDSNKYDIKFSTVNDFGEVRTSFLASLKRTKGLKHAEIDSHWDDEEDKIYFLAKKKDLGRYVYSLIEIDLKTL